MLQGGIHMRMGQCRGAARRISTVGRGCCHGHAGRAGTIGVKYQIQPAGGGMVKPDLGRAIHPAQGGLPKLGIQNLRCRPHQSRCVNRRLLKC